MKELNDKLNEQILELAEKFEKESEELQSCKKKLQEADNQQLRHEQEMQSRQEALREAQEKETILLAQVRFIIRFILTCFEWFYLWNRWKVDKRKSISQRSSSLICDYVSIQ